MIRQVSILQGTSGSGKSTWARRQDHALVVSADHVMIGEDGAYVFDESKVPAGHQRCFSEFLRALQGGSDASHLIVDNTNTQALFMAPYVAAAMAFKVPVTIRSFRAPPDICAARNKGRAPMSVVRDMCATLERFTMPAQWERDGVGYEVIDTSLSAEDREAVIRRAVGHVHPLSAGSAESSMSTWTNVELLGVQKFFRLLDSSAEVAAIYREAYRR